MDPVSAIGLASSVLTLAEFSWKIASGAVEIYESAEGMTAENLDIRRATDQLKLVSESLEQGISARTQAEQEIKRLSISCQEHSKDVLALIKKMTAAGAPGSKSHKVLKTLKATYHSVSKKGDLDKLKKRLSDCKSGILLNITILLKEDQSTFGRELSSILQTCEDTRTDMATQVTSVRDTLLQSIDQSINSQPRAAFLPGLSSIVEQLQALQFAVRAVPIQHLILRHLVTDDMDSRQNQIHTADADTCRWIVDGEPNQSNAASSTAIANSKKSFLERRVEPFRRDTRQSFVDWLQSGVGVLHVSGNPGSGKSTLMKFIANHETTRQKLREWSGPQKLVFCQFYFYSAGSPSQRTMPALFRSLLFQSLSQHPYLIAKVFPNQLSRMTRNPGDAAVERAQGFRDADIQAAFTLLLNQGREADYKFCFLIDGLDETDGNSVAHLNLAEEMKDWASARNIKLLLSSRPWREFLSVFTDNQTIHLHKLNSFDIRTHCTQQLLVDKVSSSCAEIWRLDARDTKSALQGLVNEITYGAQGVFLWAHFVLQTVLLGIQSNSSLSEIQEEIRQFPDELNEVYDKLREPFKKNPVVQRKANQMLLLAAHCPYPLFATTFSWFEKEDGLSLIDPEFPRAEHIQPYSEDEIAFRLNNVSGQMDRLTRGLLELDASNYCARITTGRHLRDSFQHTTIQFCHRTARDYIVSRAEMPDSDLRASWHDLKETDPYGRIWLAYLLYGKGDDLAGSRGEYLPSFSGAFSRNTIRRFKAPIIAGLRPLWSTGIGNRYKTQGNNSDNLPSFIQYAAVCGLDDFVLDELRAQESDKPNQSAKSGLLCTYLFCCKYDLAFAMLEPQGLIDLEGPVMTKLEGEEGQIALPEWLVALQLVVDDIYLPDSQSARIPQRVRSKTLVEVVTRLLDCGARAGKSVVLTVQEEASEQGHCFEMDVGSYYKSRLCEYYHDCIEGCDVRDLEARYEWLLRELGGCACGRGSESESERPRLRLKKLEWQGQTVSWQTHTRVFRVF